MERLRLNEPVSKVDAAGRSQPVKANGKQRGGRPAGVPNKMSIAQREAYAASGEMPLDFLVRVFRTGRIGPIGYRKVKATPDQMMEAARSAAPYLHPRLHAVAVGQEMPLIPFDLSRLSNVPPTDLAIANKVLGIIFGGTFAQQPVLDMKRSNDDASLYEATLDE